MPEYYLLNTNKGNLPEGNDGTAVYDLGVAATYGSKSEYGSKLAVLDEGDIIISYVNDDGYRAVGSVVEEWDGEAVGDESEQVADGTAEFHVDVCWEHVRPEGEGIAWKEGNKLLGYDEETPVNFTLKTVEDANTGERLADAVRGERDLEPDLYLVPAGRDSPKLELTVEQRVRVPTVQEHNPDIDLDWFSEGSIPIWGHQDEQEIEEGDYLLLYRRDYYRFSGRVQAIEYNPSLGEAIWESDDDDDSFEYIYYLDDVQELNLPKEDLNKILGYSIGHYPMGFGSPAERRVNQLRRKFGDVREFIDRVAVEVVPDTYERIAEQLEETNQVVFYGPPGTGKTYHANEFADWWVHEHPGTVQEGEQIRFVTFHPSFSYEDFLEGLTSRSEDGQITYKLEAGILKRFVEKVSAYPDHSSATAEDFEKDTRYVLIVDEINRGNIANILGETVTLLESDKREGAENETTIRLAHSNDEFSLPSNLYIIGTMNTADRSIALVDAAIRRRFGFVSFPPNYDYLRETFNLMDEDLGSLAAADTLDGLQAVSILALQEINDTIRNRADLGKGKQVGHSYLDSGTSEDALVRAWKHEVLPLLEEYFFESFEEIADSVLNVEHADYLIDPDAQQIRPVFGADDDIDEAEALRTVLQELADVQQ